MMTSLFSTLKNKFLTLNKSSDLIFLVFLLLILHVSLAVKLMGIVFIYFFRRDFKFGFKNKRIPFFYLLMLGLLLLQYAFNAQRGFNYAVLAGLCFAYWGASLLVTHQLKYAIETQGIKKVENALAYFFVFNAVFTLINILRIIYEIHSINPYVYVGQNFKYFASTGDHLRGITMDLSTVNNIINSFGLFFFLYIRRYFLSGLCFLVAMFTTSNVGNFILMFFFIYILIVDRSRFNKSIVLCYISFLVVFVIKISPSNLNYLNNKVQSVFHLEKKIITRHWEDNTEKDQMISKYLGRNNKAPFENFEDKRMIGYIMAETEKADQVKSHKEDSVYMNLENESRYKFVRFYNQHYGDTLVSLDKAYYDKYPGKYLSFLETFAYVKKRPRNLMMGAGAGNFSSKLAFKASNVNILGKYVGKLTYIAPEFEANHLKLTMVYYLKSVSEHSVINFPNSVFNQLLGEYGLIGLLLFFVFYVWFFLKKFKTLSYGRILLPMCLLFLLTDYWFESLSMVIVFEVMMYIDMAKSELALKEEAK